MFTINQVSNVVDIISEHSYDAEKLAILLAKVDPVLFTDLASKSINKHNPSYESIANFIIKAERVEAIKALRMELKTGLKETKDIIDSVGNALVKERLLSRLPCYYDYDYVVYRQGDAYYDVYISLLRTATNILKNR